MHILAAFLLVMNKIPNKSNRRKEEFTLVHSLRVQYIIARETWRQEPEAVGHMASTLRRPTEMNVVLSLLSPFSLVQEDIP